MDMDTHTAMAILHIATIGRTTATILGGHTTTDTVITATTVIITTISTKLTWHIKAALSWLGIFPGQFFFAFIRKQGSVLQRMRKGA
jgi:hypothetical protein